MPQFPMIPERKKALEKFPDYAVTSKPLGQLAKIIFNGEVVAESSEALLVSETRHADVVYLPRSALKQSFFTATDHSTYCPFKGHANYWSANVGGETSENIVWSYEDPYPEVAELENYLSFYTDRVNVSSSA